jgi:hypothetical protein
VCIMPPNQMKLHMYYITNPKFQIMVFCDEGNFQLYLITLLNVKLTLVAITCSLVVLAQPTQYTQSLYTHGQRLEP